jgi:hypothetical protein
MIKVSVYDKSTLVLEEDAKKGDKIDLSSIEQIDQSLIIKAINDGKDLIYNNLLQKEKERVIQEEKTIFENDKLKIQKDLEEKFHQELIKKTEEYNKKEKEYELLKSSYDQSLKLKESAIKVEKDKEIERLKYELETLKDKHNQEILLKLQEEKIKYEEKIKDLSNKISFENEKHQLEISTLKDKDEQRILMNKLEHEKMVEKLNHDFDNKRQELIDSYNKKISEKDLEISNLTREKSILNVKQTGEDLEAWCDNKVKEAMQNGFDDCIWYKDNDVIKQDDDIHGSKADFIFKIYSDSSNQFELSSICFDMKDENPNSVNKKKNSDYFKQLDKNREKKNCKYAVLVSNLEMEKSGDIPILKVKEYTDMYVVRPAYLLTFINLITSLTKRFKEIILKKEKEEEKFKDKEEFKEEFESIKQTYLDKPLETLKSNVEKIKKQSESILKSAEAINSICNDMFDKYINIIGDKISKFEIKSDKMYKKIEKTLKD